MHRQLPHLLKFFKQQAPVKQCHPLHIYNNFCIPAITSHCEIRDISTQRTPLLKDDDGWLSRKMMETRVRFGWVPNPKPYYRVRGLRLFREVEKVDWNIFFKTFQLPDTFYSWFLVTELHMWMLHIRIHNEGQEGELLKHFSLQYLWEESRKRAKTLDASSGLVRKAFDNLYEELLTAFLMYDHGFLTSDVELANALWYRFFQQNCDDPEKVELLVRHVREQISLLEQISREDVVENSKVTWLSPSNKR